MIFSRNLLLAAVSFFLWSASYNLIAPFLPLLARELGATSVQMGLVGSIGMLGAATLVFPISVLSDRVGRRPALVLGWVASAAGMFIMWPARSWAGLLPGVFLSMAAVAALPTLNALALEELPAPRRARGFALLYAAAPLGTLLGSAVSGFLGTLVGLQASTAVAGACLLGATLVLLPITERRPAGADETATAGAAASGRPGGSTGPGGPGGPGERGGPGGSAATDGRQPGGILLALFSVMSAGALFLMGLPGSFIVPYVKEVSRVSLVLAGLAVSVLSGAQLAWSLLFSTWPRFSGRVRVGRGRTELELSRATLQAITVCLAANALFGLLLPSGLAAAAVVALVLRGSQFALQSLGSALMGDVVPVGPGLSTRLTTLSVALGVGAAAAPVAGGWLYGIRPALPFWVMAAAAAVGAVLLAAVNQWLPEAGARAERRSGVAAGENP